MVYYLYQEHLSQYPEVSHHCFLVHWEDVHLAGCASARMTSVLPGAASSVLLAFLEGPKAFPTTVGRASHGDLWLATALPKPVAHQNTPSRTAFHHLPPYHESTLDVVASAKYEKANNRHIHSHEKTRRETNCSFLLILRLLFKIQCNST